MTQLAFSSWLSGTLGAITTLLIVPAFVFGFGLVALVPFSFFGLTRRSGLRPAEKSSESDGSETIDFYDTDKWEESERFRKAG
ncbi:MAG: hypothetical protein AB7K68_16655 [Bacteriovoracia bacterium]